MTDIYSLEPEVDCTCGEEHYEEEGLDVPRYRTYYCNCGWYDNQLEKLDEKIVNIEIEDDFDEDFEEEKIVVKINKQKETVENSIFTPKPKINQSIVGNVKDTNREELIRFLKTVSSNGIFVITTEFGKDKDNEHLHFYVEKTDNQVETIKKNLRNDNYFKKLKGKSAGGDHKYNIKTMNEKIQFYYIFKEIPKGVTFKKMSKYLYFEGVTITAEMVQHYQEQYDEACQHKKLSASNKFFYWVKNKYPENPKVYKSKEKLIDCYLTYSQETNRAVINKFDCEKMINYVILRTDPDILREEFKKYLIPDYGSCF